LCATRQVVTSSIAAYRLDDDLSAANEVNSRSQSVQSALAQIRSKIVQLCDPLSLQRTAANHALNQVSKRISIKGFAYDRQIGRCSQRGIAIAGGQDDRQLWVTRSDFAGEGSPIQNFLARVATRSMACIIKLEGARAVHKSDSTNGGPS
jgi:hypothetical protein